MPEILTATERVHRMLGRLIVENLAKDEEIEHLRADLAKAVTERAQEPHA